MDWHVEQELPLTILIDNATVFILMLSACGTPSPQPVRSATPMPSKNLSEQDNGSTVTLQVRERLDLSLAANPTTGYQWEVAAGDSAAIKQVGEPEYKVGSAAPGSGGMMTFHFVTVAPGQTTLKLIYHRPFEKDTPPLKTFEVTAVVK
jgi:inhibitor of cysteine peptidase